jgi:molecular chaperone GrpE
MNAMDNERGAQSTPDDPCVPAEQLRSLQRALEEEQSRTRRLAADFINFRRRTDRERDAVRRDGARAVLLPLLSVLDDFERAMATASTDRAFSEGVAAIQRLFVAALREARAEPIDSVGQPFDPTIHEAVATVPAEGPETDIVVREERRGWRLEGELLRAARVVVAVVPN